MEVTVIIKKYNKYLKIIKLLLIKIINYYKKINEINISLKSSEQLYKIRKKYKNKKNINIYNILYNYTNNYKIIKHDLIFLVNLYENIINEYNIEYNKYLNMCSNLITKIIKLYNSQFGGINGDISPFMHEQLSPVQTSELNQQQDQQQDQRQDKRQDPRLIPILNLSPTSSDEELHPTSSDEELPTDRKSIYSYRSKQDSSSSDSVSQVLKEVTEAALNKALDSMSNKEENIIKNTSLPINLNVNRSDNNIVEYKPPINLTIMSEHKEKLNDLINYFDKLFKFDFTPLHI
jgi:hypothetical protein